MMLTGSLFSLLLLSDRFINETDDAFSVHSRNKDQYSDLTKS